MPLDFERVSRSLALRLSARTVLLLSALFLTLTGCGAGEEDICLDISYRYDGSQDLTGTLYGVVDCGPDYTMLFIREPSAPYLDGRAHHLCWSELDPAVGRSHPCQAIAWIEIEDDIEAYCKRPYFVWPNDGPCSPDAQDVQSPVVDLTLTEGADAALHFELHDP